jgi:hypothetical protein
VISAGLCVAATMCSPAVTSNAHMKFWCEPLSVFTSARLSDVSIGSGATKSLQPRTQANKHPLNETLSRSLPHTRLVLEAWRADYNTNRPHSRLGWMSPAFYAADRRSAALRYTDGSAPRTAAITAHKGNVESQTPIAAG